MTATRADQLELMSRLHFQKLAALAVRAEGAQRMGSVAARSAYGAYHSPNLEYVGGIHDDLSKEAAFGAGLSAVLKSGVKSVGKVLGGGTKAVGAAVKKAPTPIPRTSVLSVPKSGARSGVAAPARSGAVAPAAGAGAAKTPMPGPPVRQPTGTATASRYADPTPDMFAKPGAPSHISAVQRQAQVQGRAPSDIYAEMLGAPPKGGAASGAGRVTGGATGGATGAATPGALKPAPTGGATGAATPNALAPQPAMGTKKFTLSEIAETGATNAAGGGGGGGGATGMGNLPTLAGGPGTSPGAGALPGVAAAPRPAANLGSSARASAVAAPPAGAGRVAPAPVGAVAPQPSLMVGGAAPQGRVAPVAAPQQRGAPPGRRARLEATKAQRQQAARERAWGAPQEQRIQPSQGEFTAANAEANMRQRAKNIRTGRPGLMQRAWGSVPTSMKALPIGAAIGMGGLGLGAAAAIPVGVHGALQSSPYPHAYGGGAGLPGGGLY